jgi:hypothetical protein
MELLRIRNNQPQQDEDGAGQYHVRVANLKLQTATYGRVNDQQLKASRI